MFCMRGRRVRARAVFPWPRQAGLTAWDLEAAGLEFADDGLAAELEALDRATGSADAFFTVRRGEAAHEGW